jgi:hypothetical protein
MLFVGQRARPVAIQVEGADAHRSDVEGEAEDGPHARFDGRAGEGQPTGRHRGGQIRLENRTILVVGVHAGALPEVELQLLDQGARSIRRACRPSGRVSVHQHEPCAGHASDLGAHLTQSFRLQFRSDLAGKLGEDS